MADTRHKDITWTLKPDSRNTVSWEQIHAAVLMDIRDELKRMNNILYCSNFLAIPRKLDAIRLNTRKVKRTKKI